MLMCSKKLIFRGKGVNTPFIIMWTASYSGGRWSVIVNDARENVIRDSWSALPKAVIGDSRGIFQSCERHYLRLIILQKFSILNFIRWTKCSETAWFSYLSVTGLKHQNICSSVRINGNTFYNRIMIYAFFKVVRHLQLMFSQRKVVKPLRVTRN